jgi:outer membrane protein TolC
VASPRTTRKLLRFAASQIALSVAFLGCAANRPAATTSVCRADSTEAAKADLHDPTNVHRLPMPESGSGVTGLKPVNFESSVTNPATAHEQESHSPQSAEELPPRESAREDFQIDMSTALALVAGQNPQVGFARARVREAYANLEAAHVMWLPTIQPGISYNHHEGTLQDSSGAILEVSRSSLQSGFGAGAVGAGTTPLPGIVAQFQMVDAIFQPKIAERNMCAQQHASDAVLNDQLLEAAVAYQELLRAYQLQAIAKETVANTDTLVQITSNFAKAGQGTQADADRSLAELSLRRNSVARSDEAVAVAAARLGQVIGLRGPQSLRPVETTVIPIELLPSSGDTQETIATALASRPELKESQDLVGAATERLRREKYAPLIPSVLLGASYTGFGGGTGDTIGDFNDRTDFDAIALWQVRNLGFGEQSARQVAIARVEQARFREVQLMDQVAREATEAEARVAARRYRITVAKDGVSSARESFGRNFRRIREAQGLPIEVLQSVQALDAVQRDLVDATVDYNIAEFQLERAMGWPVR